MPPDVLLFIAGRLLRRNFWALVASTFLMVLFTWVRSELRNQIFQEASALVGKQYP